MFCLSCAFQALILGFYIKKNAVFIRSMNIKVSTYTKATMFHPSHLLLCPSLHRTVDNFFKLFLIGYGV